MSSKRTARKRPSFQPHLEVLEDRLVPATRIWDGGAVIGDAWSNPKNWVEDIAPAAGDDLVFPGGIGALDRSTRNDFAAGTLFNSIKFTSGDYHLTGNKIRLGEDGMIVEGAAEVNVVSFDIELAGTNVTFDIADHPLSLEGRLSGSANLIKEGTSTLDLDGSKNNVNTGSIILNEGSLALAKSSGATAISGTLIIRPDTQVNGINADQIKDTVQVQVFGNLFMNSSETLGPIVMAGGNIRSAGVVTLNGDISGSGGSIKTDLALRGQRVFNITGNLVIQGAISNGPAGTGSGSIIKTGGGVLSLRGETANTYTGNTKVNAGRLELGKPSGVTAIRGSLHIGDNIGGPGTDAVRLLALDQIANDATVVVNSTGFFDLHGLSDAIGTLTMRGGNVETFTGTLTVLGSIFGQPADTTATIAGKLQLPGPRIINVGDGPPAQDLVISAQISDTGLIGSNKLTKFGDGVVVFSGDNVNTGTTIVKAGTLIVNGDQPTTNFLVEGGTLAGTGIVREITANGGAVNPGDGIGILTTQKLNLNAGSRLIVELNGLTAGTQHDQLDAGDVLLGNVANGAFPILDVRLGFNPVVGDKFKIIKNLSDGGLGGGFFKDLQGNTLEEGDTFTVAGKTFQISYKADGGDAVSLTRVTNTTPAFAAPGVTSGIPKGSLATLSGTIVEPDSQDTFFLDVRWGDGSATQTYTFPQGSNGQTVQLTHRYLEAGHYTLHLAWRDQNGASNSATLALDVVNAAPVVDPLDGPFHAVRGWAT